jgi:hypothetical protein
MYSIILSSNNMIESGFKCDYVDLVIVEDKWYFCSWYGRKFLKQLVLKYIVSNLPDFDKYRPYKVE